MAIENVTRADPRYPSLIRSHNTRWASSASDPNAAARILLCEDAHDVAEALQQTVAAGLRPTVRSGGHCYEDFVAHNPGGAILDLSLLAGASRRPGGGYRIGAGTWLSTAYSELYKRHAVTLPGGSCPTVGAGGHITGGGYGVLSRLHGLTVDWLSAVEIVTVNARGQVEIRRADRKREPDLFRALRGAGGGNFGVITSYEFDELPPAPRQVMSAGLSFAWEGMTPERFAKILDIYGHYWATRGQDPDTWGLFAGITLTHASAGHFGAHAHFCNPDGGVHDLRPLEEYLDRFSSCNPVMATPPQPTAADRALLHPGASLRREGPEPCGPPAAAEHLWFEGTVRTFPYQRAKYGSAYMKRNFTAAEAACFHKHLTRNLPGVDLTRSMVNLDSYGGRTNRVALIEETAVPQRASVLKLQWINWWQDPAQDAGHIQWQRDFYKELYSGSNVDPAHQHTPYWNDRYQGCYINYPDRDMLEYSWWPQLYYGPGELYPFLQSVKRRYDPNNVFHHAMSIRP